MREFTSRALFTVLTKTNEIKRDQALFKKKKTQEVTKARGIILPFSLLFEIFSNLANKTTALKLMTFKV